MGLSRSYQGFIESPLREAPPLSWQGKLKTMLQLFARVYDNFGRKVSLSDLSDWFTWTFHHFMSQKPILGVIIFIFIILNLNNNLKLLDSLISKDKC